MESQPMLPDHAEPRVLEYMPGGEDNPPWEVGDWRGLSEVFDLRKHEILHWHEALAGQGRPWLVVRRIYQVAPLFGPEAGVDDMRKWSWKELATAQGVSEARLQQDLEAAVDFWKRERLAGSLRARSAETRDASTEQGDARREQEVVSEEAVAAAVKRVDDGDGLPDFHIHQDLDKERVCAILAPLRFDHFKDPGDRLYIANRCLEMAQFLRDKHQREPTRQLILLEITMGAYELTQATLKQRLNVLRTGQETEKSGDEAARLASALEKNEKALADLAKRHGELAHKLGADDIETGEKKREALGTISYFAEAHRRYYEKGDRELIDGVFTAEEVIWLTTPLSIRPAQYRPDVVIRAREALLPENLWNGDYAPTVIQREACRRLHKLVEGLVEEVEPRKIHEVDTVLEDPEKEEEAWPEPEPSSAEGHGRAGVLPAPEAYVEPAPRDEDVMVMG